MRNSPFYFFVWGFFTTSPFDAHTALRVRCAGFFMPLLGAPQEVAKKDAKGPGALWKPAARKVVSLALHSFFREVMHLQLLRARVKETRTHLQAKVLAFVFSRRAW